MTPVKIAFRVDASVEIGTGHVARCLTLASALAANGARAQFLCRGLPPPLEADARARGIAVHALPPSDGGWEADARQSAAALEANGALDTLIVDHYGLDVRWERAMRATARKLVVIDDLDDRPHDCDLLIDLGTAAARLSRNQSPGPAATVLSGAQYALLRPEFAAARAACAPREGGVQRILVAFGGSDPTRETEKCVAAILALGRADISADIVVGSMNPRRPAIESLCAGHPALRYHGAAADFAGLMARADLAVGAGGGTAWERCCLYLPSAIVVAADNQNGIAEGLAQQGAAVNLGWHGKLDVDGLRNALAALVEAPARIAAMSRAAGALVDGQGAQRVLSALREAKCA